MSIFGSIAGFLSSAFSAAPAPAPKSAPSAKGVAGAGSTVSSSVMSSSSHLRPIVSMAKNPTLSPGQKLLEDLRRGDVPFSEISSSYQRLPTELKNDLETRIYRYHADLNCDDSRFHSQYGRIALENDIRSLYDVKDELLPLPASEEEKLNLVMLSSMLEEKTRTPAELAAVFATLQDSSKGLIHGLIYRAHTRMYGPDDASSSKYPYPYGKSKVESNPWVLLNKPAGSSKTLFELALESSAPASAACCAPIAPPLAIASTVAARISSNFLISIPGDGNCAPRAVWDQIQQCLRAGRDIINPATGRPFPIDPIGCSNAHLIARQNELRNLASTYLIDLAMSGAAIDVTLQNCIYDSLRAARIPEPATLQDALLQYAGYMLTDGNWLDKPFFYLISRSLGIQVAIMRKYPRESTYRIEERFPEGNVSEDTLFVYYNGYNHFDSINRSKADQIRDAIDFANVLLLID